jgi:hypothetical protein
MTPSTCNFMDYAKLRNEALPPEQFHMFVERTSEARMRGEHRNWTGNDQNGCCYYGKVRLSEDPLYLCLRWKAERQAIPRFVGNFEIKLRKLLINDYLLDDGDGFLQLRFYHGNDDVIYIQRCAEWPGIPVGHLLEPAT